MELGEATNLKLTSYSHGAGCGCKISPSVLEGLLGANDSVPDNLLVGNHTRDDAAVLDIGNGQAVISTTDFFMPIVDDPFDFGFIAAVNAISDVYAMGGKPIVAIAILGWPVDKIPGEIASKVLEGGRTACKEAGIAMAGGHSIDNPEPIFGLAVTGQIAVSDVKRNSTAKEDSLLYLTKPLGAGLISTAQKRQEANQSDLEAAVNSMKQLNRLGEHLGPLSYVNAVTDVTGFGLLGHLVELCEGSEISATVHLDAIPTLPGTDRYIDLKCIPGGTHRNWESYGNKVSNLSSKEIALLADPQTSGGLLISVDSGAQVTFEKEAMGLGYTLAPIGTLGPPKKPLIEVVT